MDLWSCPTVITGAASGLGAETARYLVEAGARVTLIDIDAEGVRRLGEEIGCLAIPCDVADSRSAEEALAKAREANGAARVLALRRPRALRIAVRTEWPPAARRLSPT
ncbi:MAG TPA: SDR family NAD(P)-dependent oxidoreductase, partial [Accumulibacter sp.]|nr:SDR family NAD(P)-dependent oxidoreductase [Accumulibacter sp.]